MSELVKFRFFYYKPYSGTPLIKVKNNIGQKLRRAYHLLQLASFEHFPVETCFFRKNVIYYILYILYIIFYCADVTFFHIPEVIFSLTQEHSVIKLRSLELHPAKQGE